MQNIEKLIKKQFTSHTNNTKTSKLIYNDNNKNNILIYII